MNFFFFDIESGQNVWRSKRSMEPSTITCQCLHQERKLYTVETTTLVSLIVLSELWWEYLECQIVSSVTHWYHWTQFGILPPVILHLFSCVTPKYSLQKWFTVTSGVLHGPWLSRRLVYRHSRTGVSGVSDRLWSTCVYCVLVSSGLTLHVGFYVNPKSPHRKHHSSYHLSVIVPIRDEYTRIYYFTLNVSIH